MQEIVETINLLRDTNSTLDKVDIVAKHKNNNILKKIFKMTFDPEYVYGIKQLPDPEETCNQSSDNITLEQALEEVDNTLIENRLRGNAAKEFVEDILSKLTLEEGIILCGVIQKDIKINMGSKLINKAIPGLLKTKSYMGALAYDQKKAEAICENQFFSQEKMDGMYANFFLDSFVFISRNLKRIFLSIPNALEKRDTIKKAFHEYFGNSNVVLNGELLITGLDRYTSNGLIMSISKIEEKVYHGQEREKIKDYKKIVEKYGDYSKLLDRIYLVVWDFIPEANFNDGKWDIEYNRRFNFLKDVVSKVDTDFLKIVPTKKLDSLEDAKKHFKEIRASGGEGTIIKTLDGFWKSGKPNWQLKLKHELEVELKIVGFRRGDPGTKYEDTLGAYIVETSDGKIQTKAPGLSEEEREYGWTNQDKRLNQIVSVKCNGLSVDKDGNYSLLHPRFNGMRPDKDSADSLEDIMKADSGIIK